MGVIEQSRDTLIISEEDIACIVKSVGVDVIMDETISALEDAFLSFGENGVKLKQRTGFVYDQPEPGLVEFMPAMRSQKAVSLKVVGYHPYNPIKRNIPTIIATNSLYDVTNGHMIALVDGTFATAIRTGASSAVASCLMASKDSKTLGVIGTGCQAVTQVHALSRRFTFDRMIIHDINHEHEKSFKNRTDFIGIPIEIRSKEEVVEMSDILIVATSNPVGAPPIVDDLPRKPHLHINAIGSDIPGKIEISLDLLRKSFVVPDYLVQAKVEGECQNLLDEEIGPELHEAVKESKKTQMFRDKLTVFDSTGNPMEDLVITEILVAHAKKLGLGQVIGIESGIHDPLNPYQFG